MSAIVHRCKVCGHNHLEHYQDSDQCSYNCCPRHQSDSGGPELIPTFDINGAVVDAVFVPGVRVHQWGEMCACEECQALYGSLTAIPA